MQTLEQALKRRLRHQLKLELRLKLCLWQNSKQMHRLRLQLRQLQRRLAKPLQMLSTRVMPQMSFQKIVYSRRRRPITVLRAMLIKLYMLRSISRTLIQSKKKQRPKAVKKRQQKMQGRNKILVFNFRKTLKLFKNIFHSMLEVASLKPAHLFSMEPWLMQISTLEKQRFQNILHQACQKQAHIVSYTALLQSPLLLGHLVSPKLPTPPQTLKKSVLLTISPLRKSALSHTLEAPTSMKSKLKTF